MKLLTWIKNLGLTIAIVFLVSCTLDIQQTVPSTPVRQATETATIPAPTEPPLPTDLPPTETVFVEASTVSAVSTEATPTSTSPPPEPTPTPTIALPPPIDSVPDPFPWADRDLTGRLVTIMFQNGQQLLVAFDFATGALHPVFEPPPNIWLTGASVSRMDSRL